MKVVDPGHVYQLDSLDGVLAQSIVFVKREGVLYPGNVDAHPGTTTQDVLRVLIDRATYVNNQMPCEETQMARAYMMQAIYQLEMRAARRHGRTIDFDAYEAVFGTRCAGCGHIHCDGRHKSHSSL